MRSNCIIFAVALYWRRKMHAEPRRIVINGERYFVLWRSGVRHILIRASRLGSWLPHMLYAERRGQVLRVVHFVPVKPKVKVLPPPLFHGRPKHGDSQNPPETPEASTLAE
jgi:hypothetical protein